MKTSTKIAVGAGLALALPLALLAPGHAGKRKKAPFYGRNFAHRGLHTEDKSVPENSLAAFRAATEAGYGIELDVQLSRDGQVMVFHDDTLDRVCPIRGRVDEVDAAVLRQLSLCGSKETMPLFSQVLSLVDGRVPLIVELKNGRRNRELCRKTLALLRAYGGPACIESFNPFIVAWFRFHAPELLRGQLAQPSAEYVRAGMAGYKGVLLGHTLFNFLARPEFIAYRIGPRPLTVRLSELLGALRFGWTSHEPRHEKGRDAVIFEFYLPKVKYR